MIAQHSNAMPLSLPGSYVFCERLARRQAGNFYHAFRVLPSAQRRAMCTLYAFLRITDDISDGPGTPDEKRVALNAWRQQLDHTLRGQFTHEIAPALHDIVRVFAIPRKYLEDAIDGVMMDLDGVRYQTFDDLYRYCYHVASVVGLACIHIWGFDAPEAKQYAE